MNPKVIAGLVILVGGGVLAYFAFREDGWFRMALTGPQQKTVPGPNGMGFGVYGPGSGYQPPRVPNTNETNPNRARRSSFASGCGDALAVGGAVAAIGGGPKGAIVGTGLIAGAPYACSALEAAGKGIGKAGSEVGKFFKKLF